MSTTSLPSCIASSSGSPSLTSFTSSTPLNLWNGRRGSIDSSGPLPAELRNNDKEMKKGGVRLRLTTKKKEISTKTAADRVLPKYGFKSCIKGVLELLSPSNVESIEANISGRLRLKEIAECGTTTTKMSLGSVVLWKRDLSGVNPAPRCPSSLQFSLSLPDTFTYENKAHSLLPTFHVKLSGVPGFTASVDYAVTVKITKRQLFTPSSLVKSSILNGFAYTTVSTPFVYHPQTQPPVPLPPPLFLGRSAINMSESPGWVCFQSEIRSRWNNTAKVADDAAATATAGAANVHSIKTKLYVPKSRVFCVLEPIPFYVVFESSAQSLAAFLPYAPSTVAHVKSKRSTRVQLMRQSTVDVRNMTLEGVKTDMWRVDCIGEGAFKHAGDGSTWSGFSGEIKVDEAVNISGFKAPGLSIKDWIVFSVTAGDSHRAAFDELRQVVPVRLATDPWTEVPDQNIVVVGLKV